MKRFAPILLLAAALLMLGVRPEPWPGPHLYPNNFDDRVLAVAAWTSGKCASVANESVPEDCLTSDRVLIVVPPGYKRTIERIGVNITTSLSADNESCTLTLEWGNAGSVGDGDAIGTCTLDFGYGITSCDVAPENCFSQCAGGVVLDQNQWYRLRITDRAPKTCGAIVSASVHVPSIVKRE